MQVPGRRWRSAYQWRRVIAVTSFGNSIAEAAEQSNYMLEQIHFDDMYYREDIGYEFR
jgi:phosphoribosylamine--glycine ligase